jgi:xylulokinase
MRDSLELVKEAGAPVNEIRLSGGGARGRFWRHLQADIYGQDVCTINASEGPAFGVALLAQVGTGAFNSVPEACDAAIQVTGRTHVQPKASAVYTRAYPIYRQLYQDLKGTFAEIAQLGSK